MLQLVDVGPQRLGPYGQVVGKDVINELHELAKPLKGVRVLNINATPYGGGVSELLRSLVPLEQAVGLRAEWRIISGDEKFFKITKHIHDGLQGGSYHLARRNDRETYINYNRTNSRELNPLDYDIIIIHDPQPAALLDCCRDRGSAKWIWRCHIDTSEPSPDVWAFIKEYLLNYDHTIFTMRAFVPPDFPNKNVSIIPPAIDPLSPKNMHIDYSMGMEILSWLGMDPETPFITQVSRFDKWKDPFGVIDAYHLVQADYPDLHLAMVGSMATDDPDAWEIYSRLTEEDIRDPNLHVLTNLTGVSNIEVNAFQRFAKAVIQKSSKEGFGLVVSEALWKNTPVIAGRAGGIPQQLEGGGGYLIDTIEECALRLSDLLHDGKKANLIGELGHKHVLENYLITRLLKDELNLFKNLLKL